MEIKQKKRSEIEEKYKWNLKSIYNSNEEFLKELNEFKIKMLDLKKYESTFLNSGKELYEFLSLNNTLDSVLDKLNTYAHLKNDEDTQNSLYQEYYGMVMNLYSDYLDITSFIIPTFMKYDYDYIEKFYKEYPKLKEEYEVVLKRIYREKKYTLDEKVEKTLSKITKAFDNSEEVYEFLTNADFMFDYITLKDGSKVEITNSNYSIYVSSKDRNVRKQAFDVMYKTYSNHQNSIAKCLSNMVNSKVAMSKLRGYESTLYEALYSDNIDISIYNNLIDVVSDNLETLFKYYDLKKEVLNLDELHIYDIYVPLTKSYDKNYTFEEAKTIVLNALKPLGDDYNKVLNKAFNEGWIDVFNNKGKRSGAYSSGSYLTNPFLLLNFEGKFDDVSTLAHELGHSLHTYYSKKNNTYQYSSYSIFVAEVASTVNELLLDHYILENSNDNEEKINVINNLLELYKGTLYRQTMFAEFEKKIYELVEDDQILTSKLLCDEYYKLNKKYFGNHVVLDDNIKYEWERIPHFYYFYYVFKYATSICASTYIVLNILKGDNDFRNKYLKFLTLGSRLDPVDELKTIGIDMNKKEVIQSAIDYFEELLDKFEKLYNKID